MSFVKKNRKLFYRSVVGWENQPSIWAEKSERFAINESWPNGRPESAGKKGDIYNWVATDAVLFEEPILNVKGKLGFWDYPMTENEYNNLAKIGV